MTDSERNKESDDTTIIMKGYRPERRSSELQAGARAELIDSPVTKALAGVRGRLLALMLFGRRPPEELKNYITLRIPAISYVLKQALPSGVKHPLVVEFHAAFSPLGIFLTKEIPHIDYWEIDIPEVIKEKKQRLKNAGELVSVPPNLVFKPVDLGDTRLSYVFGSRKADIITVSGAYTPPDQFAKFLVFARQHLSNQGAVVVTLPWEAGINAVASLKRFYLSQIGNSYNNMKSDEAIKTLFIEAGYSDIQISHLSTIAKTLGQAEPIELEVIITARV